MTMLKREMNKKGREDQMQQKELKLSRKKRRSRMQKGKNLSRITTMIYDEEERECELLDRRRYKV